jgi:hypothetical protein
VVRRTAGRVAFVEAGTGRVLIADANGGAPRPALAGP